MIESWRRECLAALRRFVRRPARPLMGALALALGIGASSAAFSVVKAVLLDPLPVASQDDLHVVWRRSAARDFDHLPFRPSAADAVMASAGRGPLTGVAAVETVGARAGLGEGPGGTFAIEHVRIAGDFFGVLGARPYAGRLLDRADDEPGAQPVAVISHAYWTEARGADPEAVGSTLRFGGVTFVIVGVAEAGFDFPMGTEVWASVRGSHPDWDAQDPPPIELDLIVRAGPGATPGAVHAAVDEALRDAGIDGSLAGDAEATGMRFVDLVIGNLEPVLRATLVAALLLLTVAVANATLLFLAGGGVLLREGAVRRALGASRASVVAPLAADAALQAAIGVLFGVALAWWTLAGLIPRAPGDLARFDEVSLDLATLGFAGGLGMVGLLGSAGLAGAWLLARDTAVLLAGGSRAGAGGQGLRRAIAVGQVALAVVASIGAGLLWRSVSNLEALDRGFEAEGLHVVALSLPFDFFDVPAGYMTALADVTERLSARPGVEGVSVTMTPPLSIRGGIDFVPQIDGQSAEDARRNPYIGFDVVSRDYFTVARTGMVDGRAFGDEDGPDSEPTIIVNAAAAASLWPGESALGRQMFMGGLSRNEWRTVVGVAENHRFRSFPDVRPTAYVPVDQYSRLGVSRLLVRGEPTGGTIRAAVTEEFVSAFPGVDVLTVDALSDVMNGPLVRHRFAAAVLMAFSMVTLVLAALGVHGVFMVLVQERRQELGIRKALGAADVDLVRFITIRVASVAGLGVIVGVGLSTWTGGLLETLYYDVTSLDAPTIAMVAAGTLLAGLMAGVVPAIRAARTDPVESLRAE